MTFKLFGNAYLTGILRNMRSGKFNKDGYFVSDTDINVGDFIYLTDNDNNYTEYVLEVKRKIITIDVPYLYVKTSKLSDISEYGCADNILQCDGTYINNAATFINDVIVWFNEYAKNTKSFNINNKACREEALEYIYDKMNLCMLPFDKQCMIKRIYSVLVKNEIIKIYE